MDAATVSTSADRSPRRSSLPTKVVSARSTSESTPCADRSQRRAVTSTSAFDPTDVAGRIGRFLGREAMWHRDRCTWLGARPGAGGLPYAATLDPWLYEGTAGVGLFLAELHSVTGDRVASDTANGALRHALRAAEDS